MIILFPTELEATPFRKARPDAQIIICGVGAAECAATAAEVVASLSEPRTIVLAGVAGSYSLDDVALTEVVEVVEECIEALPERFSQRYINPAQSSLRGVVSNSVNSSSEATGVCRAQIENMEGAALFALCQRLGVPCIEVRAISNRVGDPFPQWSLTEACEALSAALLDLIDRC